MIFPHHFYRNTFPQAFDLRMLPKTHSFGRNDFGTSRRCFPFGGIHPAGSESPLL
ncbi:hypothetical protein [uncultured Chryseobacterium sp.]|uniref:hypothetical protein n=1 Tax=uncultured Chryseobacterium sp. TaxID=259322 RepID=UPI00258ABCD6|nr:hypothetical protein [uncultured Chryseobacterium sp.]